MVSAISVLVKKIFSENCSDVHYFLTNFGHEISSCLIPFHALTGCESTSCLKGIGKKKALKVLKSKIKDFSKLKELGDKLELPNELIRTCESFICQLYELDSKNNYLLIR